jgi:sugar (pentulose or hexulose) kinase
LAECVPVVAGAGDSITAAVASALAPGGPVLTVLGSAGNVSAVFAQPLIDLGGRVHTGCHASTGTWIATGVHRVPVSYYPVQPTAGPAQAVDSPAQAVDSSALGAAIIAGTAAGMFGSLAAGAGLVRSADPVVSQPDPAEAAAYQAAFARYQQVTRQLRSLPRAS